MYVSFFCYSVQNKDFIYIFRSRNIFTFVCVDSFNAGTHWYVSLALSGVLLYRFSTCRMMLSKSFIETVLLSAQDPICTDWIIQPGSSQRNTFPIRPLLSFFSSHSRIEIISYNSPDRKPNNNEYYWIQLTCKICIYYR